MVVNLAIIVLVIGIPLLALGFLGIAKTSVFSDIHILSYLFSIIVGVGGIITIIISLVTGITVDLSKLVQYHESQEARQTSEISK